MGNDWESRHAEGSVEDANPARVITDNAHLLPSSGAALDLACGLGGNAVLLARHGLDVHAWDTSATAIGKLAKYARVHGLALTATMRDVVAEPPEPERYDVIVVSRFLERSLAPTLSAALRPHGLLFYQTFTRTQVTERGPRTERFRLDDNELLRLFAPLRVVVYREEGSVGDTERGFRDEALLIAQRPNQG